MLRSHPVLKAIVAFVGVLLIALVCIRVSDVTADGPTNNELNWYRHLVAESPEANAQSERNKLIEELKSLQDSEPTERAINAVSKILIDFANTPISEKTTVDGREQQKVDLIIIGDRLFKHDKTPELIESIRQGKRAFLDPASRDLGAFVILAGLAGGLLASLFDWKTRQTKNEEMGYYGTLSAAVCGAAAAPIGVFVLANSNPSDWVHCCLFGLICGFSWRGILEQAQTMVKSLSQQPTPFGSSTATSAIANANSSDSFKTAVSAAVDDLKRSFSTSVLMNDPTIKLASKNQSNQVISAIYLGLSSANIQADDATVSAAISAIVDVAIASVPLSDLNILDVAVDKITGIAREHATAAVKQTATAGLQQIVDAIKDSVPQAKVDFVKSRMADIAKF